MLSDDPVTSPPPDHRDRDPVAPLWHTLLVIAAVLSVSLLGLSGRAHASMATHHVREYTLTLAWEWLLAALVLWGLRLRRTPLRVLLGQQRPGMMNWLRDAGIALVFWVGSAIVLSAVAVLLKLAHFTLADKTVAALAPRSVGELLLFLLLSLSAGFSEELLFRGYFEKQFTRLGRGRVWVGIAASALLFGSAHLYEGLAGVVAITIFGVMFSLLALERRSLRPGMMAHAWHDALSGVALFLLRHSHVIS